MRSNVAFSAYYLWALKPNVQSFSSGKLKKKIIILMGVLESAT